MRTLHNQQTRRRAFARLCAIFGALSLALGGLVGVATPAVAADGNILPPFGVGETWNICQGYNGGFSHNDTYSLDLTGSGCDNSASGRTVRAPLSGTVSYYQASYGNLCINTHDGRSIALVHINSSLSSGAGVNAGDAVGTVAAPGQRANNGVSHIHLQMWPSHGCWDSGQHDIPFDSAHNARICGAPDLTSSGPSNGNGTWSGTSFTGRSCGGSTPPTGNVKSISVSPQGSEEHIFTVDGTNTIRETYLVEGQSPQTVEIYRFSGHTARDVASLIVDSKRFVYVATAEGEIYEFSWLPGDAPAKRVIADISGVRDISVSPQGSEKHIFTVDTSNALRETYLVNGQSPQTAEIYRFSGNTPANVASYIGSDNKRFVYMPTSEGRLYEFSWMPGDTPARRVIANISGVRDVSVSPQGSEKHIFTVDTSRAIRETYLVNGQSPQTAEIYRFSGNTPTGVASLIMSNARRYVYMSTAENRMWEFSWMPGGALTKETIATF